MIATVPMVHVERGDIIRFPEAPERVFEVEGNNPMGISTRRLNLFDPVRRVTKFMDLAPGHPVTITGHKEN
jgi:hypothetical protein